MNPRRPGPWTGPAAAAALLAVDPAGLGGAALRTRAGPARDQWLALLRRLLPAELPLRRVPLHADDSRLLGGLDLAATLRMGRPIAQLGLLAQTDGGLAVLASAERLPAATCARLAQVMDTGHVAMERNGLSQRSPAQLGLVALDEGADDDEKLPPALLDRMAFHIAVLPEPAPGYEDFDLRGPDNGDPGEALGGPLPEKVRAARLLLPQVLASDAAIEALCATALALGVASLRAPLLALRAARAAAALEGCTEVSVDHCTLAASLVLAPRATRLPEAPSDQEDALDTPDQAPENQPAAPEPEPSNSDQQTSEDPPPNAEPPAQDLEMDLENLVLQAAQAAIPAGLLAALKFGQSNRARSPSSNGSGAQQNGKKRGRPAGARRGEPGAGARLNLMETLRAAAPWQKLRRREAELGPATQPVATTRVAPTRRIEVRREDFHVSRFKQRLETTTIFAVDASGSAALHRLAETKGAVELLLADCYVRRDRVAVIAFRGKVAELLLPPTRSLVRAKRSLAGLPGGGGTPLAAGMDAARELALACGRRGETPIVVLLTDGRANIARDGSAGRERATTDALAAASSMRAAGLTALLLDTSPQPQPGAQRLADAMGAAYLPLPYAGAAALSQAVRLATPAAR